MEISKMENSLYTMKNLHENVENSRLCLEKWKQQTNHICKHTRYSIADFVLNCNCSYLNHKIIHFSFRYTPTSVIQATNRISFALHAPAERRKEPVRSLINEAATNI